jgi:hypothetical protein
MDELERNADIVEDRLRVVGTGKDWLLPLFGVESGWPPEHSYPYRLVFAVKPAERIFLTRQVVGSPSTSMCIIRRLPPFVSTLLFVVWCEMWRWIIHPATEMADARGSP